MIPQVVQIPDQTRGFDCNTTLTTETAQRFRRKGFKYAYRYVGRSSDPKEQHSWDLTTTEVMAILMGGLAVGVVQHVESAKSWIPSVEKGVNYGNAAADNSERIGIPKGVTVFCDLEGVDPSVPHSITYQYCINWYGQVAGSGYEAGLYVGWHCGLNAQELWTLPFKHYWIAYNLNHDQWPARRGPQMRQMEAHASDRPEGVKFGFDTDIVTIDALGGLPTVLAPEEW